MADDKFREKHIPLNGRLRTNTKGITIGEDFKQLINLRYGDLYPRGIQGHSKINTNVLDNPKIRAIHHLRKEQPAESHILVQALDSNGANPKIYNNTTAIPSTGNFVGSGGTETVLFTEDTSAGVGRFANAPDGAVVYCNKKQTCIWGGTEFRVASFIRYDPDNSTKKWDYSEQISNTLTTEYATLVKSGSALDSSDKLLLHCDGSDASTTFTDTVGTHSPTANGNAQIDTADKKFGTASGLFDGTGDYLTITDHADFDLSGGTWSIDFWMKRGATPIGDSTIYWQGLAATPDDDYMRIWNNTTSTDDTIQMDIYTTAGGGTPVVTMSSYPNFIGTAWTHVAIVESGDNFYMFFNGTLVGSTSDSDRAANYNTDVYICGDGTSSPTYFNGWIDEFRLSNGAARWTSAFTPPAQAYPLQSCEVYVGSILPIQGIHFNVGTANTSACTPVISYWDGSDWTSVGTVTDGTNNGTGALEQDGEMTFTSTESTAKARIIDSLYFYWYKLSLGGIDDTTVTNVTVDIPFQTFKDIWDGELRAPLAFIQWDAGNSTYYDHTVSVFEDYYDSADSGTYAGITNTTDSISIDKDNDYLLLATTERLSGLTFNLVGGKENATDATMGVSYWDGDSWVSVGTIVDGTLEDNATLAKSGFVTWNALSYGTEFKRQDLTLRRSYPEKKSVTRTPEDGASSSGKSTQYYDLSGEQISKKKYKKLVEKIKKSPFANAQFDYPLYWYRIDFSATIAGDIQIYHIGCIPAQADIGGYNFPVFHDNCIWLLGEGAQHKNQAIKLSPGTVNVANGNGTAAFQVGDEEALVAGGSLTLRVGEKILPTIILFKKNQTWAIYGSTDLSDPILLDSKVGCLSPGSVKPLTISTDRGEVEVIMFQSHNGVYICNGSTVEKVSKDIENLFDQTSSTKILTTRITNSESFYDDERREYHWLWTSTGTTHDKEYVFDCERIRWYEVQRGSGAVLQCGAEVRDTSGIAYTYGGTDDGYLMRLENGKTFATAASTNNITYTFQIGDIPLIGQDILEGVGSETQLRNVCLHSVSKTSTSNTVAVTHYGDTSSTASSQTTTFNAGDSGEEVQIINWSPDVGPYVYHSLKFVITNSDDTIGFEPVFLALMYKYARQRTRGT